MGGIKERLRLTVGLLLYIFDYGSDIYVAYRYWENGDVWWFGITVGFIVVPSILVNITAIIQVINYWTCLAAVLQLSIVFRYLEAIVSPTRSREYHLAQLRYLETITESAPQWCLQSYIMLRQWDFPWYTLASVGGSLLSLAWSITSLEKTRRDKKKEKFNPLLGFCFLTWQLLTLISRLSAIVIVGYVFTYYVFILLAGHWLLQTITVLISHLLSDAKYSALAPLAAYPSLFHSSVTVLPTANPKNEMIIGFIFIVLENLIMVTLSAIIELPDVPYMETLRPIAIGCIAGGSIASFIFSLIFICLPETRTGGNID